MLVARTRKHVVGLERHVAPELPCHADGALPAVRDFRQLPRGRSQFLQVPDQASGRIVICVAEELRGLIEGGQRPIERVRRKIGAAVIICRNERDRRSGLCPLHIRGRDIW